MPKKNTCPRCGGSFWRYIRNGKWVGRCGNCGFEEGSTSPEQKAENEYPRKLKWDPSLMEEPVAEPVEEVVEDVEPEPEVTLEEVLDQVDTGLPAPDELIKEEPKVEEPAVEEPVEEPAEETVDEPEVQTETPETAE